MTVEKKDRILLGITLIMSTIIVVWGPCLIFVCGSSSLPGWLSSLYSDEPLHFPIGRFVFPAVIIFPVAIFASLEKTVLQGIFAVPAFSCLVMCAKILLISPYNTRVGQLTGLAINYVYIVTHVATCFLVLFALRKICRGARKLWAALVKRR